LIYGSIVTYRFWQFHMSALTLFLLSISCIGHDFIDAVDSIRRLSLSIIDDFKVYSSSVFASDLWINSDIAFLTIPCVSLDSVFCNRFDASVLNSLTLLIPYVGFLLVFIDDFKVYIYSFFRRRFMDQPWHSVFDNSMSLPWLYFCNRFDVSVVNSLTLSITYVGYHLVFIDDFKVYSYSIFTGNLRISRDIAFLTIPYVSHDSIFAINLMHRSLIEWCCRFHTLAVTQFSVMISSSTWTLFSLTIYGSAVTYHFLQFPASPLTLFFLSIWCVGCEFMDVVDYIRRLSLSIHWRFQGLKLLCFHRRFLDQQWHSVFDNSMHQPWLYLCYRFDALVVNSLTLSIPYDTYHFVFIDDIMVYNYSVFAGDF